MGCRAQIGNNATVGPYAKVGAGVKVPIGTYVTRFQDGAFPEAIQVWELQEGTLTLEQ